MSKETIVFQFRFAVVIAALAIPFVAAVPARADIAYGGATSADIAAMLASLGYPATAAVDGAGHTNIKSRSNATSTNFEVYFYDCKGTGSEARCGQLQFTAGFSLKADPALELLNKWNTEQRWGRAYVDRYGVHLETDFDCSVGMTQSEFRVYLKHFEDALPPFRREIGYDS